jgi:hypothetical protein
MKKKFCTGKVGKVSFLGAALFSAMCMFSVTVFAGPGDDDDDIGGSSTGATESSFQQLNMQLSLNGVPVNLTPDMQTAIQAIINANLPQQETPSAMPSVTPNVTSQMPNFNDSGNDSLDHLFFHVSDYEDDLFLDDSASIEFEELSNAGGNSALDLPADHDALSDNSSVAIQRPARRGDSWRYHDERGVTQNVVLELGEFLQYSRLAAPCQKAKIMNLASAYLSCPELRVTELDSHRISPIYEKLHQNPELLQKLRSLIGNTDFKNYASQYKDKPLPRIKSDTVLTEAGKTLRHALWHFAREGKLISAGSRKASIPKMIIEEICNFVFQVNGIDRRITREEKRDKIVLLNNMAANYRGAFDAFFRAPYLKANCAQWCKDNGYVKKPRGA